MLLSAMNPSMSSPLPSQHFASIMSRPATGLQSAATFEEGKALLEAMDVGSDDLDREIEAHELLHIPYMQQCSMC